MKHRDLVTKFLGTNGIQSNFQLISVIYLLIVTYSLLALSPVFEKIMAIFILKKIQYSHMPPKKRSRTQLTLEEKLSIILYSEENPSFTHVQIADHYSNAEKRIDRSTKSKILKEKQAIREELKIDSINLC